LARAGPRNSCPATGPAPAIFDSQFITELGAATVSFAGAFTDSGGANDTASGSNSVKYSVSATTDAAGDTILNETISTSFSIGVASTRADGGSWGLDESSTFNYKLHEVDTGNTITYTLSENGNNSFSENDHPIMVSYAVNNPVVGGGSNGGGSSP